VDAELSLKKWTLNVGKNGPNLFGYEKENRTYLTQTSPDIDLDSFLLGLGDWYSESKKSIWIRIHSYPIIFYSD
jgi:hypothetical protein